MLASSSSQPHSHTDTSARPYGNGNGNSTDNGPPSNMPSPQGGANDLFPLDFLTFSNFDASSPHHNQNSGSTSNGEKDQIGMDFDLAQFQQTLDGAGEGQSNHSHTQSHSGNASGSGSRRGSIDKRSGRGRSSISSLAGIVGMEVDQQQQGQMDFQALLDAAAASGTQGQESYDQTAAQAGLLQQQLEHIHMQSPLIFGNGNGQQSNYNNLAHYLASPPGDPSSEAEVEKKKWMLATGLGGMFTPGPSSEMIAQNRPDQMSPIHLEMLAREFDGDFTNIAPLMSPALSQQQSSSSYTSPQTAMFASSSRTPNQQSYNTQQAQPAPQSRSPLEALQIQQRHFQEQLALLQHQQRQLQATAEAVAAASNSPYVNGTNPSSGSSRPVTTPGVGSHSTNPSPSYFSPLTSPALEATNRSGGFRHQHQHHQQHSNYSPNFDPRAKRQPHPLSALSSPALNPIGSSGGAQQTLSPALNPQNNTDMSDPDYYRALVGMLDGSQQVPQQQVQQRQVQQYQQGSTSNYSSPAALQYIDTSALSSPMVGPQSATSNGHSHGPGPNRQALPSRTRPSPMIKPSPHIRGHHSRQGSTSVSHSPNVQYSQKFNGPSVPQPNYLPPAAIDQRGVQAHHQQIAQSTTSETPSPVDLSTIMPPPPLPNNLNGKAVTPMTPASLMNLGGKTADVGNTQEGAAMTKRPVGSRAAQTSRPIRKTVNGTAGPTASGSGANGAGKKVKIAPAGKRALAARPPGVGVRAATKGAAAAAAAQPEGETRKTSHKAAEQKRRDSLKAGFDELRLLLPPINTEALDPESGEPIPGSSAPRLLPKSSLVPDDNPNRGVSKVALLKFSNEYIERLHEKVDKRDEYIERLRQEVSRLRTGEEEEVRGIEGQDLLEMDMMDGEEEYDGLDDDEEGVEGEEEEGEEGDELDDMELDGDDDGDYMEGSRRRSKGGIVGKSPALGPSRVKA